MLSPPQIVARLSDIIAHIYSRPKMYGQTVREIDVALSNYHIFWTIVQERESEFYDAIAAVEENTCRRFADTFQIENPGASDEAVLAHLLAQWRIVSERLGIDLQSCDEGQNKTPDQAK